MGNPSRLAFPGTTQANQALLEADDGQDHRADQSCEDQVGYLQGCRAEDGLQGRGVDEGPLKAEDGADPDEDPGIAGESDVQNGVA